MAKENSNLCKRSLLTETILGIEGLGHECKALTKTLGLPNLRDKYATTCRADINRAIWKHSERRIKKEVKPVGKWGTGQKLTPGNEGTSNI